MQGRHIRSAGMLSGGRLALLLGLLCVADIRAAETISPQLQDPHRNAAGFFDIHVCNWPNRELFQVEQAQLLTLCRGGLHLQCAF